MRTRTKQRTPARSLALLLLLPLTLHSCALLEQHRKEKGRIHDFYITDARGERIDSIDTDTPYFYLVIDSEHMYGAEVQLDLTQSDIGYIFRRQYLDTGQQIKFKIRRRHQRLKVYFYDHTKWTHRRAKRKALKDQPQPTRTEEGQPPQPLEAKKAPSGSDSTPSPEGAKGNMQQAAP